MCGFWVFSPPVTHVCIFIVTDSEKPAGSVFSVLALFLSHSSSLTLLSHYWSLPEREIWALLWDPFGASQKSLRPSFPKARINLNCSSSPSPVLYKGQRGQHYLKPSVLQELWEGFFPDRFCFRISCLCPLTLRGSSRSATLCLDRNRF